mgnify:CR=1 FL=1
MDKYFVIYNDKTNLDVNLLLATRSSKPSPEMEYEEVKVPGGKTLYREKGYKDIAIPISFNFMSKYTWDKDFRIIKKWLLSKINNKLKFSDDLEVYYKVNKVTIDTPERILKRVGRFNVTFICEPYVYIDEEEMELSTLLYNDYLISKPIYRIVGEGYLTLNINNKIIKANVGQELIIDTEKGLCYREGIVNNVALEGKYEDMYLLEGENTLSWTDGFKVYVTPNWRCL